jgi:hypothetical protein
LTVYTDEIITKTAERLRTLLVPTPFKSVYGVRTYPTKDDMLPCATVALGRDRMDADGDDNAGEPSFKHRTTINVSALCSAESQFFLTGRLNAAKNAILAALLSDPEWLSLVEAVSSIDVSMVYPNESGTVFAEARIALEVTFRTDWPPVVPDDFLDAFVTEEEGGNTSQHINMRTIP